jgi:3'(2'), 5'-bisphosphate nucleotidase
MTDAIAARDLTDSLTAIARDAGRAIMAIYAGGIAVREKADRSPVTDADEAAEAVIVAALERLTPAIPIVAEERTARGIRPSIDGRPFWLVDPLDGTREFLNRNGEFTVNVALIERGDPVAGVVYVPAKGRLYAGDERGAFREDDGAARQSIRARVPPGAGVTVLASRSHNNAETQAFVRTLRVAAYAEAGSSLKFCAIAEGAADVYPRLGRTMEWDTAAGHAVLAAAGGSVTTIAGAPLTYGKPDFVNPSFVARGCAG